MELTKQAKIDSFLLSVEFNLRDLLKIERFELGSVFNKDSMKNNIGGLFTAYCVISGNLYTFIKKENRVKLNNLLNDINAYTYNDASGLYDIYGIEKLEKHFNKLLKLIM